MSPSLPHHPPMPTRRAPFRRTAPSRQGGAPLTADSITWTREVTPRERYRIEYVDRDDAVSSREIELLRLGHFESLPYAGVMHLARFKTLRLDRIRAAELLAPPLSPGREPALRAWPTYRSVLPPWTSTPSTFRIPTIRGSRTWLVELATYTCACPEKRERSAAGYTAGQLGFCCLHIARAILDHLPPNSPGWTPELLAFLEDRRRLSLDNLT